MIKGAFILSLLFTSIFANPYKTVTIDEQLTLFTNYFINETIKEKLPKVPKKGEPKENDYNYEPTKYELYYNYVQRIKAIRDSLKQEQKKLQEKYATDIYRYNNKLKSLSQFYKEDKNLYPLLAESFNKALKVVYGKPILIIKSREDGIGFFLDTYPIYKNNKFTPKAIEFNYADEKKLFNFYKKCDLSVTFIYENNTLKYDEVICNYKDEIYQGEIKEDNSKKIKLNVKINDDIFQQIKIPDGDTKE